MPNPINRTEQSSTSVKVRGTESLVHLRSVSGVSKKVLPGVEAIGAGYNPFMGYASADHITVQLFDWANAEKKQVSFMPDYEVPRVIDAQQDDRATYNNTTGTSIDSYQSNLATSVNVEGGFNYFSGSLNVDFSEQSLRRSESAFSRIQQSITLWSLRLAVTNNLRDQLRADVRDTLDQLPLEPGRVTEFFNFYGSHFLTGIVMGGSATLASATNKLEVSRAFSIKAIAKASYEGLTGQLSTSDEAKYKSAMESFNQTSESHQFVVGGDGVKAASAFSGKEGFDAWKGSVGTSPNFIDFVPSIPMAGIWHLCKSEEQATYMENHFFNVWAPAESNKLQLYPNYVDALIVITGDNSEIQPPAGYTKIPYDLNAGAEGDYIYLCYHKASYKSTGDNVQCITDVKILFDSEPTPDGWVKLPQDLNRGAQGAYVYLCYHPAPYENVAAVKDVTIIGGSNPQIPPPYAYKKIEGDLNAGAEGQYIYVCLSNQ